MGIYERDYVRNQPHPRGGFGGMGGGGGGMRFGISAMRMWSVTTWLIVICIAVFIVDGFLPGRLVQMSDLMLVEGVDQASRNLNIIGWDAAARDLPIGAGAALDVVDPSTGQMVGKVGVRKMKLLESFLHFSTERGFLKVEFWRFIGFQFLHFNFTHILFNMIGLFFFGPIVERHLGSKRYLAFYLLCGMCGAFMYLLLNVGALIVDALAPGLTLPVLLFSSTWTPLLGASAGVFGVLIAGAYLVPNATAFFLVFPMRLATLAYLMVGLAFFTLITSGHNAGGEAAHIGGAIAGFYFIRNPRHLHGFFDILGRVDPTSHHYNKEAAVRRKQRGMQQQRPAAAPANPTRRPQPLSTRRREKKQPKRTGPSEAQVDIILDKIQREGMHSLTEREKKILRDASSD